MLAFDEVPVGKLSAAVHAWSPDDASRFGVHNWSLKPMQEGKDMLRHPSLAGGLSAALCSIGTKTAYAPDVAKMSAFVASPEDLKKNKLRLSETDLYRNPECPADGVFLQPGEAFVMSAAGCPIVIATAGKHMIVAHAGRDSLVERDAVIGKPRREHVSVVYSIINELLKKGEPLNEIRMAMMFSVPMEMFDHHPQHPEHGEYNRKLADMVDKLWLGSTTRRQGNIFLDMETLFANQARECGVRHAWATHSLAYFHELAHTRDGRDPARRNLFIVKRNA